MMYIHVDQRLGEKDKSQHYSLLKDVSLLRLVLLSVETCLECDVHTRQPAFGGQDKRVDILESRRGTNSSVTVKSQHY